MAEAKVDKRTLRTQEALRDALLELIFERGYENSSVQDILDLARIGRATFYTHYGSKEDLLKRSLDVLHEHLIGEWKASSKAGARAEAPLGFSLTFFRHVDGHRKLYRAIRRTREWGNCRPADAAPPSGSCEAGNLKSGPEKSERHSS